MVIYLFDYYTGIWKSHVSPNRDSQFRGAERVLTQKIEMEPTLLNVSWLANLMTKHRDDLMSPIDAPEGVKITVLSEQDMIA